MMQSFLLFLLFGVLVLGLLVLLLGLVSYRGMIHYRMRDEAYIRQAALDAGDFDASAIDLPWIEEDIASPGGYSLRVHALEPDVAQRAGKVAVFHHGIGWGWLGMIRYMELFRQAGWAVVAYDSRGHGSSGGGRPSYGYYEKRDLAAVVDWAIGRDGRAGRFPSEGGFVIFGESMGAATVLQYAPLDSRLDAVIADCPYSSALGELKYRLRAVAVPPGLRDLVAIAADALCRRLEGFSLRDANPEAAILDTEVPILFIHGLEDKYVPYAMSLRMAESRKRKLPGAVTELLLMPGARHAQSIRADKARYVAAIHEFLEKALPVID
jgi:pimeloyl-ACP methyl ester carboxylesterase